jgi:deazaflavin-dependent oxidoreductase (nitroreductase family)
MAQYQKPDALTTRLLNPLIATLTKLGLSVRGSHVLAVRGRKTGKMQEVPVNPVTLDGVRYLVAPRGETQWVRNLRAAGRAELRVGQRREPIHATALEDEAKPPVLRAYLQRWKRETGKFFGVDADVSDAELARIAPDHPVFRIKGPFYLSDTG